MVVPAKAGTQFLRALLLGDEANTPLGGGRRCHEFANGVEHRFELPVVFCFQRVEPAF